MASSYSGEQRYGPSYQLPPVTAAAQGSRPGSAQSPWSASSQNSAEHLSLTLPSLSEGDLAQEPSLYDGIESPSIFLPEPSSTPSNSQPQHIPTPPAHSHRQSELYAATVADSPDLFLNFEGNSQPQSPRSPATRASSIVDLTQSSPAAMAPPSRKRKTAVDEPLASSKRRLGISLTEISGTPEKKPSGAPPRKVEELDMVNVDDDQKLEDFRAKQQADLIRQQNQEKADKPIKLTDFQCIICLDNPTDLTVTHCGHLFCSMCLHEALHAGNQRKTCPVCRQQINLAKNKEGKQPKNGVFVLEMKLMTARRKEKQPQGAWS